MERAVRFAGLFLDHPEQILVAVQAWIEQKREAVRAEQMDEPSARAAAELIANFPDGNPSILITRPMLPAALNMAVKPGTSEAEFTAACVVPFLRAQRRLREYQTTACNMISAECNQLADLVDMLQILLDQHALLRGAPASVTCLQYVVLHLVHCDLLPTSVFADELRPHLSLYDRLGSEEAHAPVAVTSIVVAHLQAWLARQRLSAERGL